MINSALTDPLQIHRRVHILTSFTVDQQCSSHRSTADLLCFFCFIFLNVRTFTIDQRCSSHKSTVDPQCSIFLFSFFYFSLFIFLFFIPPFVSYCISFLFLLFACFNIYYLHIKIIWYIIFVSFRVKKNSLACFVPRANCSLPYACSCVMLLVNFITSSVKLSTERTTCSFIPIIALAVH